MKSFVPFLMLCLLFCDADAQLFETDFTKLDEHIVKVMDSLRVPGLQIAVTSMDSVLFIKGFGYSDLDTKTPVDPYQSKFLIGSLTKTFTGIAIQNAANNGSLSLTKDINDYLDFDLDQLPNDTITLNDLLSHSAGIDEIWLDGGDTYINRKEFGNALKKMPLKQVRPSGETFSYSNISINLAAYILSEHTKKPAFDHFNEAIIDPLEMENTGVSLDRYAQNYPISYYLLDDLFEVSPRSRSNLYASGFVYSTAEDMSKFMRALLNDGVLDSTRSFSADFLTQIGDPRFAYKEHPEYGSGLGIFITDTKKGKVYSHLGFIDGFATHMYLFENEKIGIFTSANSQKGIQAHQDIFFFFLKNYLPHYKSDPIATTINERIPEHLFGNYIPTRTSLSTLAKIDGLFSPIINFDQSPDGIPLLKSGDQSIPLVHQENHTFIDTTKFIHKTISFNDDGDRVLMNFAVDDGIYAIWPFMKLKWYEQRYLQYPFRILTLLLFIVVPIVWLFSAFKSQSRNSLSWRKVLLSIAMLASSSGLIIFAYSSLNYERLWMESIEALPWQLNAFALLNITSVAFTVFALTWILFNSSGKRQIFNYFIVLMLISVGINNYLFNSFSYINY